MKNSKKNNTEHRTWWKYLMIAVIFCNLIILYLIIPFLGVLRSEMENELNVDWLVLLLRILYYFGLSKAFQGHKVYQISLLTFQETYMLIIIHNHWLMVINIQFYQIQMISICYLSDLSNALLKISKVSKADIYKNIKILRSFPSPMRFSTQPFEYSHSGHHIKLWSQIDN